MFESDVFPRPDNLKMSQVDTKVTGENKGTISFYFVPENTVISIYDSLTSQEPIMTLKADENSQMTTEEIDFTNYRYNHYEFARLYYTITPELSHDTNKKPDNNQNNNASQNTDDGKDLPNTSSPIYTIALYGLLAIIIASFLFVLQRKRQHN